MKRKAPMKPSRKTSTSTFVPPALNEHGELVDPNTLFKARVACGLAYAKFRHPDDLAEAIVRLVDNGTLP